MCTASCPAAVSRSMRIGGYRASRGSSSRYGCSHDCSGVASSKNSSAPTALRGSDVKAWLLRIVKNCYLTALKQQQRRAFVPLPEEHDEQDGQAMIATTPDPESTTIGRDEQRMLEWLLSGLPEEHREVLVLREIEEMDYHEIAAVTSVPIGTVMSRLSRARAALKARCSRHMAGVPHAVR